MRARWLLYLLVIVVIPVSFSAIPSPAAPDGFGQEAISLTADETVVPVGTEIELTALLGDAGIGVPIQFQINGSSWGSPVNSDSNGKAEKSYSASTPGIFVFKAVNNGYSGSNQQTVTWVGISKLQYEGSQGYVDVSGTLYVPLGSSAKFKAVTDPDSTSWPSGKPVWSGTSGATGSGETKTVTFNVVSTSSSDYKTVTVTCGSMATANIIVYEITPHMTAVDNFSGRSTVNFGVKEAISLDHTVAPSISSSVIGTLEWSIHSGTGDLIDNEDGTGVYTVADSPEAFTLSLSQVPPASQPATEPAPRQIAGNGVGPTSGYITKQPGSTVRHTQNKASVGFKGEIFFEPKNVSFQNLVWAEGACIGVAKDDLVDKNGEPHAPNVTWLSIGAGNATTGSKLNGLDTISTGDYPGPFTAAGGTFDWDIPWYWGTKAPGAARAAADGNKIQDMRHHEETDAAGKATISKGGHSESKNLADVTVTWP